MTAVARKRLQSELRNKDINPNFEVQIISDYGISRLGQLIPDLLEFANIPYSRVVIGGTIEESAIETIGVAQHIDIGNFELEDESLVLLDVISLPEEVGALISINLVPIAEDETKENLVATVVGNIIAHEAGP